MRLSPSIPFIIPKKGWMAAERQLRSGGRRWGFVSHRSKPYGFVAKFKKERSQMKENDIKGFKRSGFSVFVNYVSKKIHPLTLKEAFSVYGKVLDVYIAYNNSRRRNMQNTFAFVRFSKEEEGQAAVEKANNRVMDGFKIKVYWDRKQPGLRGEVKSQDSKEFLEQKVIGKVANGVDGRSFKEVLVSNYFGHNDFSQEAVEDGAEQSKYDNIIVSEPIAEISINIKEKDKQWLKKCLVGQIVAMYDASFVQQMLTLEGFKVKVSCWSGYYVIISFEEEEQIEIFWDLKESVLKPWLVDIDTVENFMIQKKLRVWVSLEGLPLEAWNEAALMSIGSLWGNVIRLDTDTSEKNRLDVAKILIGVKCPSAVPPLLKVTLNGEVSSVKVRTSEYEEERVWLDNEEPNSWHECPSEEMDDYQGKVGLEMKDNDDSNSLRDGEQLISHVEKAELIEKGGDSTKVNNLSTDTGSKVLKNVCGPTFGKSIDKERMSQQKNHTVSTEVGLDKNNLYEVQIVSGSSISADSSQSVSIEPVLDPFTGLFSIKPKLISPLQGKHPLSFPNSETRHAGRCANPYSKLNSLGKFSAANPVGGLCDESLSESAAKSKVGVGAKTDCVLCSQWIGDPSSVPDIFRSIVADILQLCEGLEWSIKSIQRSENGTADKLAKSGISRSYPLLRVKP
ncbi:hypothetical protein V6N11_008702 [Hibiscus sabdariffa]|uniref:RRM domain-containing protein n=2 Tax=Hibiscus sabdariffa TaxID=183260 RepID=A0ABR2PNZ1_9ROSI